MTKAKTKRTPPNAGKGRPKGAKNKRTIAAKEFADAMLGRPAYKKKLQERIDKGRAPHMEQLLWFYRHGKPKETVKHEGEVIPPFVVRIDGADGDGK